MPSLPAYTVYAFGFTSFISGLVSLASPQTALATLDLPPSALPAANGNALAAIAMGLYYTLAGYQENRTFFWLTVPMRMLTAAVFWRQGGAWKIPAAWEAGGAVLTGLTLYL